MLFRSPNNTVIKTGDFDGDGKLEIFTINQNPGVVSYVVKVLSFDQAAHNFKVKDVRTIILSDIHSNVFGRGPGVLANNSNNIDVGDVNGDGKTDLVYFDRGAMWDTYILFSNGNTFEQEAKYKYIPYLQSWFYYSKDLTLTLKDVNYDNKADMILETSWDQDLTTFFWTVKFSPVTYTIFPSVGNRFSHQDKFTSSYNSSGLEDFGDFNGDGNVDKFAGGPSGEEVNLNLYNQKRNYFVRKIENARNILEVEYVFIKSEIDYNAIQRIYEWQSAFNQGYKPPLFVVNHLQENNIPFRYSYKNGIYHPDLGFLGFNIQRVVNVQDNLGTENQFTYNLPKRRLGSSSNRSGQVIFTPNPGGGAWTYKLNNNISDEFTENYVYAQVTGLPPKIYYKQQIAGLDSRDYLKSVFYNETSTYDENSAGNLVQVQRNYTENGSTIKSVTENFTYASYGALNVYLLTEKSSNIVTFGNGATSSIEKVQYQNDANYHLTAVTKNPTSPSLMQTTAYSNWDGFGNAKNVIIQASDISPRNSSVAYDNTGRFIVRKTNAINDIEEFTYDPLYGNVIENRDISGLITKYQYDGLGRLTKTQGANNASNLKKYEWDQNGNSAGALGYSITVENEGLPKTTMLYNNLGNVISTRSQGFNGIDIVSGNQYNSRNKLTVSEEPHFENQPVFKIANHVYEPIFFRKYKDISYINKGGSLTWDGEIEYLYNNPSTNSIFNKGYVLTKFPSANRIKKENNGAGQINKIYNYPSGSNLPQIAEYTFHANGQYSDIKLTFQDGGISKTSITYDARGFQLTLVDQSAGTSSYQYNSVGELVQQNTPNGNFTFDYDVMGRLITKVGSQSGITTYQYITATAGREQIGKITGPNSITEFKYDNLNRKIEVKETMGSKVFKTNYAYDNYGNLIDHTYPGGFLIKKEYDEIGNTLRIKNGNTIIWECNSYITPSRINQYTYGNGITTNVSLDAHQNLSEIDHGSIHKQEYDIHFLTGNQIKRKFSNYTSNPISVSEEQFTFDGEQRLDQVEKVDGFKVMPEQTITYWDNGNIKSKTDAGTYVYSNASSQPYNLTGVTNPANNISLNTLNVSYNDIKKVSQISEIGTNKQMNFIYGNNSERIKMIYSIGGTNQYTRCYAEDYDLEESGTGYKAWSYVFAPTGLAAVNFNNNGTEQLLYTITDPLGSPVSMTDEHAKVVEEFSFDPWGRRRNDVGDYSGVPMPQCMIRGFTLHEHIEEFGLINMNGRVYDPILGRFIQPDNFVQLPDNFQTFNRFGYALNNPLKYNDPSGNIVPWVVAGIIGGVIGGAVNVVTHWKQIDGLGSGLAAFGIGAAGGFIAGATFGAGVAAGGGMAMMSGAAVFNLGGTTALMGAMTSNIGNHSYFGDPVMTQREMLTTYLIGGATAWAGKVINDAIHPPPKYMPEVDYLPRKGVDRLPTEVSEGELMQSIGDEAVSIQEAPKSLTINRTVDLDGNISGKALTIYEPYPPNNGFLGGYSENYTIPKDAIINRYGAETGKYFSNSLGTPQNLSLPPGNNGVLTQYQVMKPIPVKAGLAAPNYGKPGLGVQYMSNNNISWLRLNGFIVPLY